MKWKAALRDRRAVASLSAVITGAIVVACYASGGPVWAIAALIYLLAGTLPGTIVYLVLRERFHGGRPELLETVFFSNMIGLGLLEGSAWILARSGIFSFEATLALVASCVLLVSVVFRSSLRQLIRGDPERVLPVSAKDAWYLGALSILGAAFLLPLLLLLRNGSLVGSDTAVFSLVGTVTAHTGAWPTLSQVWQPFAAQEVVAPGIPMLYAVFSAGTATNGIYFTVPLLLVPFILTPLGLYLLTKRVTTNRWIAYAIPLAWMVACYGGDSLFYNTFITSALSGFSPDSTFSLAAYVAALIALFDLLKGRDALWFESALLAGAVLVVALDNQLTLVLLAPAVLFVGVLLLGRRGVRWTLARLGVVLTPILVALPPYLYQRPAQISPVLSGSTRFAWADLLAVNWSMVLSILGEWGEVGLVLVLAAGGVAVFLLLRPGTRGARALPAYVLMLALLAGVAFYLAFTPIGGEFLGVNLTRFSEFVGIPAAPAIAYLLGSFAGIKLPRPRVSTTVVTVALVGLLVVSSIGGASTNWDSATSRGQSSYLFTTDLRAAGDWLSTHAPAGSVIAADGNGGNLAINPIRNFAGHPMIVRPRTALYSSVYLAARPTNLPYYYANLVMTDPTLGNAIAAYQNVSINFYLFQVGFSDRQIAAFALLPYFPLVYSNPQVAIFELAPSGGVPGFIPATSYCGASPLVDPMDIGSLAYSWAFSMPAGPNAVGTNTSNGTAFAGSSVSYCLDVPATGNYTIYVHRYTYQTGEYLRVSDNGTALGTAPCGTVGPDLCAPFNATLAQGSQTLRLTFEGTVSTVGPIDYLVVVPERG